MEDISLLPVTARRHVQSCNTVSADLILLIALRMPSRRFRWPAALLVVATACHDASTQPDGGIGVGESFVASGAQSVTLTPGETGGQYIAVVVNTNTTTGGTESFTLRGSGLVAPTGSIAPTDMPSALRAAAPTGPTLDRAFEGRLRDRERLELGPRWGAARSSMRMPTGPDPSFTPTPRRSALPATVQVGDMVTVNVNGVESCTNPIYHRARVAAIGAFSIILADSLNPPGGFTDADYVRYAARFDTLVYPLDVSTFGQPTDLDGNGRIGLIFSLEVNRLTPANSSTYVGGFTFSRDLFPLVSTPRANACAGSNQGEFFYLLTPDPFGRVNGNRRTAGFVDSNTTAVIAHEFQHLINASRRLYITNAPAFEEKWLDEGLAHIAEELLFYHEAGLSPRANIAVSDIQATQRRATAFNLDMTGGGNTTRYRSYLGKPVTSSPYAGDDSLTTRGAAWSFLRYLADHAGPTDGNIFMRLANGPAVGMENLQAVFGKDTPTQLRNWAVSNAVDDVVATDEALQQPSWNWHSIYPSLYGSYPLPLTVLVDGGTAGASLAAGGAAYFKLAVPPGSATLTLGGASRGSGSHLQLVVVRTR